MQKIRTECMVLRRIERIHISVPRVYKKHGTYFPVLAFPFEVDVGVVRRPDSKWS
jgi:hypothetical protein